MFIKETEDRQEEDLKHFYLPYGHDDFGLDHPRDYGNLIYVDENGIYHEEKVVSEKGDYSYYYDALYETLVGGKAKLVKDEEPLKVMEILEAGIQMCK